MEADLLFKEDEYRKENEKLELKTKKLLQQVNDVMKIQDNLIQDALKPQEEIIDKILENDDFDKDLSEAKTSVGIVKIYRTKIKNMTVERQRREMEFRQKSDELRRLQKENQQLKEDKEKWFFSYNTCKTTVGKLETQLANQSSKLQSKETETTSLKKEIELLKKNLKTTTASLQNSDVRLTRMTEENDKLKVALKQARDEEKDVKEDARKQINEATTHIKQAEKQKLELLNGFKKQMQLIDVLKKQKVCLEHLKITEMTEAEYLKILNWKFD